MENNSKLINTIIRFFYHRFLIGLVFYTHSPVYYYHSLGGDNRDRTLSCI